jgi:probable RNA-binding protein EIF1AD
MSMPTKFRNVAYVKAGDYVLVEAIDEGDKVRAEMVNLILPNQIPDYIKRGIWPERFKNAVKSGKYESKQKTGSDSESDDELFRNVNRPISEESDTSDSGDESGNESDTD